MAEQKKSTVSPIKFQLGATDSIPKLQWSPIGVHFYAFLGNLGFHIAHMDNKSEYSLSVYVHTPKLRTLYRTSQIASVELGEQLAATWLQEQKRAQIESWINEGETS